jgi:hypothetical protein
MAVTRVEDTAIANAVHIQGFRFRYQSRAIANTDVQVVPDGAPPVQLVTTSGTGPAVLRLPLAAADGTVFIISNLVASTQSLTVTDDAGSPATVMTLATDTGGMVMKVGAAYQILMEGATMA